jgi:hypothetical protein
MLPYNLKPLFSAPESGFQAVGTDQGIYDGRKIQALENSPFKTKRKVLRINGYLPSGYS